MFYLLVYWGEVWPTPFIFLGGHHIVYKVTIAAMYNYVLGKVRSSEGMEREERGGRVRGGAGGGGGDCVKQSLLPVSVSA